MVTTVTLNSASATVRVLKLTPLGSLCLLLRASRFQMRALRAGIGMNSQGNADYFNLRRNLHRLEKGLIQAVNSRPFGQDYIEDTVRQFATTREGGVLDASSVSWAVSVLDAYFDRAFDDPAVRRARARFEGVSSSEQRPVDRPYLASERPPVPVSYEDMLTLARRRRSIRVFLQGKPSREVVERAMEVAALSPSACNRQSFLFRYFDQPRRISEILSLAGGFAGFRVPGLIAITGRYRAYFSDRDVNVPLIDASLAAMSFQFALETLGLASVCINWPAHEPSDRRLRRIVSLAPDEFVVMLLGVGYADPDGRVAFSAKRPVSDLLRFEDGSEP